MTQQKPVVLIATGTMNAGGTESLLMETFRQASGRVRYILLIHYENQIVRGVFDDEIRKLGTEIKYIPSIGSIGLKNYVKEFKSFVNSVGRIDIVHSHLNGGGGVIALAAKNAGIKHRICHCHADIHFTGSRLSKLKNEIALAGMKGLIELFATERWACSYAAWKRLYMPWRKKVVINNMIDTRRYLSSTEKIESAKRRFGLGYKYIVGAVGRVAPIKNYEVILKAIADSEAHFVCFGRFDLNNHYCQSLEKLTTELGINDRVHWMGNSSNVAEDIHCIDLFVMPSFTEGFGMAAIEAQAAGIPSLLSTGVPPIVDLEMGLAEFLPPCNVNIWRTKIKKMPKRPHIDTTNILTAFTKKGFDAPNAVTNIENRYLSLLK